MVGRKLQGSCSSRGEKNDLRVLRSFFVSKRRGCVLHALEKIKSAEDRNEREKEQLLEKLATYEFEKKQQLNEQNEKLKVELAKSLAKREQELADSLRIEEERLFMVAEESVEDMEKNYLDRKELVVQNIIERVISEYGSQ